MRFIDREAEMRRLMRLSDAEEGGLVVLWGRRRIGKSELLKEWCRRAGGLYTVADRSLASVQRQNFALAVSERLPGFADVGYPSWKALFDALSRQASAEGWHGPLALDEIPYWIESDASVVSVLQNWIDREKAARGLLVAIAGSSQHMMHGLVLDADSPIYGRADEKIRLQPLDIRYVRDALGLRTGVDAVKAYALWGGVPRYWVSAQRFGRDLDAALDDLVLDPMGPFHEEPATILQSEIPSAISLKPYLDVVGMGVSRISEIAGRLGLPATTVSKPLARLVELGLVKREVPYGENDKGTKRSLYRIDDPFCRLWFGVVASRRSVFDSASSSIRKAVWRKHATALFAAEWEELSRAFVVRSERLAKLAGADDFWLPAGRWWHGNEPELDVVAFNGAGDGMLLGEAKWSERPFARKEVVHLAGLLHSRQIPPHFPPVTARVLFLSSVASDVPHQIDGVTIVTSDEIVKSH